MPDARSFKTPLPSDQEQHVDLNSEMARFGMVIVRRALYALGRPPVPGFGPLFRRLSFSVKALAMSSGEAGRRSIMVGLSKKREGKGH